jgi:hypothetical protein
MGYLYGREFMVTFKIQEEEKGESFRKEIEDIWAASGVPIPIKKNPDIRTQKIGCRTQFSD